MRPPFLLRLSNALDALRGRPCSHKVDAMTVELNVDTSKLEEGLARAKARLAEFEAASKTPSPRLMIRTDRKLSPECQVLLRNNVQFAVESGKAMVFEPGMTVYQLVAGRWEPIGASPGESSLSASCGGALFLGDSETADLAPMLRAENEADAQARARILADLPRVD